MTRLAWFAAALAAFAVLPFQSAVSQQKGEKARVQIAADEVVYDAEEETVTARGNVVLRYRERVLYADTIHLSRDNETATAEGNIRLVDPAGHVLFAEKLSLTGDLREGFIQGVNILFSDRSRLAASEAKRKNGDRNILEYAVYSPCEICEDHPERPPTWQIKAQKVTHKENKKRIIYKNAYLEFFGVPVFWLPYLSHPDPSVDRQSGFLIPEIDASSELGGMITIPYFFNIAPHRDFTFAPTITTDEGIIAAGEYRERTKRGRFTASGSVTKVGERNDRNMPTGRDVVRGHAFARGGFKLNERWRWGFDAGWTTDDTYLRRYDIDEAETLTSEVFAERVDRRSYLSIQSLTFQGLRQEDIAGLTPYILPRINYAYAWRPLQNGLRFDIETSAVALTRPDGFDTRRLSGGLTATLPHVSKFGLLTTVRAELRGDVYHTTDFVDPRIDDPMAPDAPETGAETEARILPRLSIEWRMPFARAGRNLTQIVEPIAMAVVAPDEKNDFGIPNEDSLSFQFDETNLFEPNRFNGYDRWEGGVRVAYGLRYSLIGRRGRTARLLIGESYQFDEQSAIPVNSGLATRRSDWVGGLTVRVSDLLEYTHSLRLDKDDFGIERNEASVLVGPSRFRLRATYLDIKDDETGQFPRDREEIRAETRFRLSSRWRGMAHLIRDLQGDGQFISAGGGFIYEDECIALEITARRDFTRDRQIRPSTSVGLRIRLKHLGI